MKATEEFKKTIKAYLDRRAADDELFAVSYAKPQKTIDQCVDYILMTVHKSGANGFTDDEVFSMAVHYYDEDNLGEIKAPSASVVVNHHVELSPEEKEAIRAQAKAKYEEEMLAEYRRRNNGERVKAKVESAKPSPFRQMSLFDETEE